MSKQRVVMTVTDGVADVRFNRPDKLNALDEAQFHAVAAIIAQIGARRDIRCVVLSGEGRAFSVGVDLDSLAHAPALRNLMPRTHGIANLFQQAAWGWRTLPVPVIAAVHGYALGAGCQIMLGADIRFCAPDTDISVMEMRWGLVPDVAGMALLRGLVRQDHLREIIFTGRRYKGAEAEKIGLVTHLAADPHAEAIAMANEIAASSPDAMRAAKRLLNLPWETTQADMLLAESREQEVLLASDHHAEAVDAGRNKRAAVFRD
ncbi:crotonase/enoyl-CoA hydratase family protein [Sphingobium cupriresistens]|uniref:Enoyl-CoA hydratase n=1 Tax=Sphingobium cupriresistens LL01 TaxID=1420583 RepID=A0A0J7XNI7_9SPHN|nr:crotonase/enoyl-CoA hydratase family protein [Sphingobium cupriresistens]KMS53237.1 enoyl-CoA hydratase [Sphingobium cupriresistens LL01]